MDKMMCMRCKCAGAKSLVPYKIIMDKDGNSVKFIGQLCERCFKEIFDRAPTTEEPTEQPEVESEVTTTEENEN